MDTKTFDKQIKSGEFDAGLMVDILRAMSNGVTTVAKIKGLTKEQVESVYRVGSTYYETGKYEEAEKVFAFLCMLDHINTKYWTAFGATRQAQRKFKEAIDCYAAGSLYNLHAPKPHFYAAQCYLALGELDFAESGCRSVLKYCPAGDVENDRFRAKAESLLKTVTEARGK